MVHLARHGQTAYNREGRFQGHLPVPLDDTGRAQAHELAEVAAGRAIVAVVQPAASARARPPTSWPPASASQPLEDARFAETDTGDWTDRSFAEVQRRGSRGLRRASSAPTRLPLPRRRVVRRAAARVAGGARRLRAQPGALPGARGLPRRLDPPRAGRALGDEPPAAREIANASLVTL